MKPNAEKIGAKIGAADEQILNRFLDGELAPAAMAAFAARLAAEPVLHRHFAAAKAMRAVFQRGEASGRMAGPMPSAGFTAGVLAATRQLPTRQEMEQSDVAAGLVRICQRLLLAAAIVLGLGLTWHSGLFDRGCSDTLHAAPDEIEREMQRLDALIQSGVLEKAPGERRAR